MDEVLDTNCTLCEFVIQRMEHYFESLEGERPRELYDMVIKEVEKGFFKVIMQKAGGNQTLASQMCGLARGTLRKKLEEHNLS